MRLRVVHGVMSKDRERAKCYSVYSLRIEVKSYIIIILVLSIILVLRLLLGIGVLLM